MTRTAFAFTAAVAMLGGGQEGRQISAAGWGPVQSGMSVAAAKAALGGTLVLSQGFTVTDDCRYMESSLAPDLLFMIEDGQVVRVETTAARYSTPEGIQVGDVESTVRQKYAGRLSVKPHAYDQNGHYFVVATPDRRAGIVMETSDQKVVAIRGGLFPAVEYVEGCS